MIEVMEGHNRKFIDKAKEQGIDEKKVEELID